MDTKVNVKRILVIVLLIVLIPNVIRVYTEWKEKKVGQAEQLRASPPDNSVNIDKYIKQGMSSLDAKWQSTDFVKASEIILALSSRDYTTLPRYHSMKSGDLFSKIVSKDNFPDLIDLFAIDYRLKLPTATTFIGEYVWAKIEVPDTYSQQFGSKQQGGFLDIIQPIIKKSMFGWGQAVLNLALRLEYTDYNVESFNETGGNIFDHRKSIVPAISFRPSSETVFRFNYRMDRERDILGNPSIKTVGYQFGFSSYF